MTIDDVRTACQALSAQGVPPSGNTVLAWLKTHGRRGSKRTALKYLHELAAAGAVWQPVRPEPAPACVEHARVPVPPEPVCEADDDPVYHPTPAAASAAPPVPADPVTQAEQALQEAEAHFAEVQDSLLQAKGVVLCTRNVSVDGVLYGSLHPHDAIHQTALDDVVMAKQSYDQAWQQREDARQELERVTKAHREVHQKRWVQVHRPDLVTAKDYWTEELRVATSNGSHLHAKKELGAATMAYEAAWRTAPWNGISDEED